MYAVARRPNNTHVVLRRSSGNPKTYEVVCYCDDFGEAQCLRDLLEARDERNGNQE